MCGSGSARLDMWAPCVWRTGNMLCFATISIDRLARVAQFARFADAAGKWRAMELRLGSSEPLYPAEISQALMRLSRSPGRRLIGNPLAAISACTASAILSPWPRRAPVRRFPTALGSAAVSKVVAFAMVKMELWRRRQVAANGLRRLW